MKAPKLDKLLEAEPAQRHTLSRILPARPGEVLIQELVIALSTQTFEEHKRLTGLG
jgi:hypothetical protein